VSIDISDEKGLRLANVHLTLTHALAATEVTPAGTVASTLARLRQAEIAIEIMGPPVWHLVRLRVSSPELHTLEG
jgi:hypothetical protein